MIWTLAIQVYLCVTLKLVLLYVQALRRRLVVPIVREQDGPRLLNVVVEELQCELLAHVVFGGDGTFLFHIL